MILSILLRIVSERISVRVRRGRRCGAGRVTARKLRVSAVEYDRKRKHKKLRVRFEDSDGLESDEFSSD